MSFAVALDHVVDDFLVGLAGLHLLDHLIAEVNRKLGVRIRNRLILADEAAELFGHLNNALVRNRVEGRGGGFARLGRPVNHGTGKKERAEERSQKLLHHFSASS